MKRESVSADRDRTSQGSGTNVKEHAGDWFSLDAISICLLSLIDMILYII